MPAAERTHRLSRQRRLFLIATGAGLAVFVLVAILLRTGVVDSMDLRINNLMMGHHRQPFTAIGVALDRLDTWWLLVLLIAALVGGLWWSGRMVQSLYLGVSIALALIVNPLLKIAFARHPPGAGQYVKAAFYAFPSGHTTTATVVSTALAVIAWPTRWRWPMIAFAAVFSFGMAASRVYLSAHWTSDVVAGLAVGFTLAMGVRAVMPWPSPQEAAEAQGEDAAPAAGERGATITAAVSGGPGALGAPVAPAAAAASGGASGIDVVFLDWGNTLMVDNGMREGPMKDWEKVEAEAGAQEALLRLRARYRLVVATNAADSPASDVRAALARVGLHQYVDDVISSADVGDHKPNYAFFRAALLHEGDRGLPLDPRRAVMVGDGTTNDIKGAQRAGIRTIWYNPTKRRFPEGAQPPDAVIRKLSDLPAVVARMGGVVPEKRSRKQRKADAEAAAAAAAAAAAEALRAETAAEDAAASAKAAIPDATDPDAAAEPAPDALASAPAGPPDER